MYEYTFAGFVYLKYDLSDIILMEDRVKILITLIVRSKSPCYDQIREDLYNGFKDLAYGDTFGSILGKKGFLETIAKDSYGMFRDILSKFQLSDIKVTVESDNYYKVGYNENNG